MKKGLLAVLCVCSLLTGSLAEPANRVDLCNHRWRLWLDREAEWEHDELFLPPVDLAKVPVNAPSCGWDKLSAQEDAKAVQLPATVEEYFWGANGNSFGISGNYVGVSWFSTEIDIPEAWRGKRIALGFESVRLRAEVYVDQKLVGYDLINGTPFEVDLSEFVTPGQRARLDIRITDPNGNFAWRDWETYTWGHYEIPPSHGFGGITGKVVLKATDQTYIDDLFIKNLPELTAVDVEIGMNRPARGELVLSVLYAVTGEPVYSTKVAVNGDEAAVRISLPDAKLWSVEDPNLYTLRVDWMGEDGAVDRYSDSFGFRWFEVREVAGDKQFYLNGKRVFLLTAISWGHWPVNGIYPTDELAKKQVSTAKELGLNMLTFHRGIGQEVVLDYADKLGLMYYAEPGGYAPGQSDFTKAFKREKLLRMVRMMRNHPSLVIYNMINEAAMPLSQHNRLDPWPNERQDMLDAHQLDETRIITYTSTFFSKKFYDGKCPEGEASFKMHMLPYSDELLYDGWWDEHHAGGPGVYQDHFYGNPTKFHRKTDNAREIIFWGEDGAIGTPHRLELLKAEYERAGKLGWDGDQYLGQYDAFDTYLTENGFREAFPSVDDLTKSMGRVSHYYQGRIIENARICNITDGYAINGWEGTKIENHSGMVDIYRNPKTDPELLAHYNQPLYVAVKLRKKVVAVGDSVTCDFFIVNQVDLKGSLDLIVTDGDETLLEKSVSVTGGATFGELLSEGLNIPVERKGYTRVDARLMRNGEVIAKGFDEIFAVDRSEAVVADRVAVSDAKGVMQELLDKIGVAYTNCSGIPETEKVLLVGDEIQKGFATGNFRMNDPILDWVSRGNTLVIIKGADVWAEFLNVKEVVDYRGSRTMDKNWFGGNFFVREHPLFDGLPVNQAFNWEYNSLARYWQRDRFGLRLGTCEKVVGCYADHKQEVMTSVALIPVGKGKIILSTLDLQSAIQNGDSGAIVAERILRNYLQ